jgi:hypothetical protein
MFVESRKIIQTHEAKHGFVFLYASSVLLLHLHVLTTHKSCRDSSLQTAAILFSQLLICLLGLDEETVSVYKAKSFFSR